MYENVACAAGEGLPVLPVASLHMLSEPVATAPPFAPDPLVPVRVIDVEDVDPAAYSADDSRAVIIGDVGPAVMPTQPRIVRGASRP